MQKYCYYHECESFNACARSVVEMLNFEFWKFIFINLKDVIDPNDAVSPSTSNPHNTHFILHLFVSYLRARACMKVTLCYLFSIGST